MVAMIGFRFEYGKIEMAEKPKLELFENPSPERDYVITIRCPEFTSVCPKTGQPDFGEIIIEYTPVEQCIELKSLKFYLQSYRDKGVFYEALTNEILDDLVEQCEPLWMKVTAKFSPRGGIITDITAEYDAIDESGYDYGWDEECFYDEDFEDEDYEEDFEDE